METLSLAKLVAPILLFVMTMGMGMTLVRDDIRKVVLFPKAVGVGLINQMLVLPLVGLALVFSFDIPPPIAVGLLLLTFCPGGVGSNVSTLLAKGDVALSIGLTLISGALVVFTLPVFMNTALEYFMGVTLTKRLPVAEAAIRLFVLVVLPVGLGMMIRHRWPVFSMRSEPLVKMGGFTLLAIMLVAIVLKEHETLIEYVRMAGAPVILLCMSTMSIGLVCGRIFGLESRQRVTIAIEVGIQNTMLALVISGLLGEVSLAIPAIIYTVVSSIFLIIIILWANLPAAGGRKILSKRLS